MGGVSIRATSLDIREQKYAVPRDEEKEEKEKVKRKGEEKKITTGGDSSQGVDDLILKRKRMKLIHDTEYKMRGLYSAFKEKKWNI